MSAPHPSAPRVALFVTCLVDAMRPRVGFAAVALLEDAGCVVDIPRDQTCCGQPALNFGDHGGAAAVAERTISPLEGYDAVVVPSGSCAGTIGTHYPELFPTGSERRRRANALAAKTFELFAYLAEGRRWRPERVALDAQDARAGRRAVPPSACRSGRARQRRGHGRERPAAIAPEVHVRGRRDLGGEFLDRRHGRGLHGHKRRQRGTDHDAAARSHRDRGDREARPVARACDDLAAPARSLGHRRGADAIHDLPLRPAPARRRRWLEGFPHRAGRQRPHPHARRRARRDALPALRGLSQLLRRLSPDRRRRLRRRLSGTDGRRPHAGARRTRGVTGPAARLHAERAAPGGLPGEDPAADASARMARPGVARGARTGGLARRPRGVALLCAASPALPARDAPGAADDAPLRPAGLDRVDAACRRLDAYRDFPAPARRSFMDQIKRTRR